MNKSTKLKLVLTGFIVWFVYNLLIIFDKIY